MYNNDIRNNKVKLLSQKKVIRNFCFLKTTHKSKPKALTNTCIIRYDIKASGIYWKKKDACYQVLPKTNFTSNFGTRQSRFRLIASWGMALYNLVD